MLPLKLKSKVKLQVDGPQKDHDDDDDTDDDKDGDDCKQSSEPITEASSVLQIVCLGCRQEYRLA